MAIIQAAAALFARHGFEQVSLNAVAADAGVSKANIFHHFASKEGLYQAVLVAACRKSGRLLNEMAEDGGSAATWISRFAEAHLNHLFQEHESARLILRELLEGNGEPGRNLPREIVGENFSRLVASIEQGQSAGILRESLDPATFATILVGANVFFFLARDVLGQLAPASLVASPETYSRDLADLLLFGALTPQSDSDGTGGV